MQRRLLTATLVGTAIGIVSCLICVEVATTKEEGNRTAEIVAIRVCEHDTSIPVEAAMIAATDEQTGVTDSKGKTGLAARMNFRILSSAFRTYPLGLRDFEITVSKPGYKSVSFNINDFRYGKDSNFRLPREFIIKICKTESRSDTLVVAQTEREYLKTLEGTMLVRRPIDRDNPFGSRIDVETELPRTEKLPRTGENPFGS